MADKLPQGIITIHSAGQITTCRTDIPGKNDIPDGVCWIDLLSPSTGQEKAIEQMLDIDIPTRDELRRMDAKGFFSESDTGLFMTCSLIGNSDKQNPVYDSVTFMLAGNKLITCRYHSPSAFGAYARYLEMHKERFATPTLLLEGLVSAIINRTADIINSLGSSLTVLSGDIFVLDANSKTRKDDDPEQNMRKIISELGRMGTLAARTRNSLEGIGRMLDFLTSQQVELNGGRTMKRLQNLKHEIRTLNNHIAFLSQEVNFLSSATFGLISLRQNRFFKILSIASLVLMPPTLIAGVFGMNFTRMPELAWLYGYPYALLLMIISALAPYLYFKRKGWFS